MSQKSEPYRNIIAVLESKLDGLQRDEESLGFLRQGLEASEAGTDEDHDDVGLFHDLEECDRTVVVRDVGQHERPILNKTIPSIQATWCRMF